MLLRMEMKRCPGEHDKDVIAEMIRTVIKDIGMNLLGEPHVYFVKSPAYNEGLTGIATIETSHIAFHFWTRPQRRVLHHRSSRCLLQMDVYTCGTLRGPQISKVLHHLTQFGPTHVEITVLNRNMGLTIQRHNRWWEGAPNGERWVTWIDSARFR